MSITVNTNVASMIAQNNLSRTSDKLSNVLQQLSTGLRINSAKDDAAGLAIAIGMKNQISGNERAKQNIQDGLNLMTTAEGGMEVIEDHLDRIRELCVQAANEIYNTQNRISILNEIKQRVSDIDVQSQTSNFNGIHLLNGTQSSLRLQFGAGTSAELNSLDIASALPNVRISAGGINVQLKVTTNLTPAAAAAGYITAADWDPDLIMSYMDKLDSALDTITASRSKLGAFSNRLEANYNNLVTTNENIEQSRSRIMDVDVAAASTQMTKYQILEQTTTSVLMQANQVPQLALSLLGS